MTFSDKVLEKGAGIWRLKGLFFLQYAIWGSYLTSQGRYLAQAGFSDRIGLFFIVPGIVPLIMPALTGWLADRRIQAQKLLAICHLLTALAMTATALSGMSATPSFSRIFGWYCVAVWFYTPTLPLSNTVAFHLLERGRHETSEVFPRIRIWGTIGFITAMWTVDLLGFQQDSRQYFAAALLGIGLSIYAFTLPACPPSRQGSTYKALKLLLKPEMARFFLIAVLMGVALQISNSYANPYLADFGNLPAYANCFGVRHSNLLISISQVAEVLCMLLVPSVLRRWNIQKVLSVAMLAWALRFALFGFGNPAGGLWMFVLSMLVYGIAFNFFNISGTIFVESQAEPEVRAGAQGLFSLMTNGLGATLGMTVVQWVVNRLVSDLKMPAAGNPDWNAVMQGWRGCWWIFAGYMLLLLVIFVSSQQIRSVRKKHADKINS